MGEVTEIAPHPDADKLRVVTLDIGEDEPHTVVCGAWNFDVGAVVPVALPGAVLPGGFEIGTREIRGVPSPGMICSERELGIGEDADGILVLDDDHAPPGADFASSLPYPDVVFDLSITNPTAEPVGVTETRTRHSAGAAGHSKTSHSRAAASPSSTSTCCKYGRTSNGLPLRSTSTSSRAIMRSPSRASRARSKAMPSGAGSTARS